MDEIFVEQIVKRKTSVPMILARILMIIGVILITFLMLLMGFGMIAFTVGALLIYCVYLFFAYTNVEYEYSFLNGDLTIDKIMGQRKRKTVAEYDIKKAEIIASSFSDEVIRASHNAKMIDYSTGAKSDNLYSMIVFDGKDRMQVVFEPNEKIINAMYHVRPNIVKINK